MTPPPPLFGPTAPAARRVQAPTRRAWIPAWALIAIWGLNASGCRRAEAPAGEPEIRVAAAADLTVAFEALGREFESRQGRRVTFTFGSTGLLAKQIREGAPFDVFAAANIAFAREVAAAGACDSATLAPYALGRVVVWSKRGGVAPVTRMEDLADPRFRRIALANPDHAPYGQAAREALQATGVWSAVEPRLAYGENVRQTLQFAESGNVEAALVALALVVQDRENPWMLVDDRHHRPIEQAMVVCTHGANRAGGDAFVAFVASEPGRALMRRFGFLLPGERPEPAL